MNSLLFYFSLYFLIPALTYCHVIPHFFIHFSLVWITHHYYYCYNIFVPLCEFFHPAGLINNKNINNNNYY